MMYLVVADDDDGAACVVTLARSRMGALRQASRLLDIGWQEVTIETPAGLPVGDGDGFYEEEGPNAAV